MFAQEVLRLHPQRRVKAYDGMAVTADTWDLAHDTHRRLLEIHTRFAHGPGIVYGLEVFAGDPPGAQIYVQPGFAVDALGRTIVMPDQRGYDLRAVTMASLRSQLGIVLQDTFLFSGTIADNIRYGRLDATDEEVIDAAQAVGAHEFISRLPKLSNQASLPRKLSRLVTNQATSKSCRSSRGASGLAREPESKTSRTRGSFRAQSRIS